MQHDSGASSTRHAHNKGAMVRLGTGEEEDERQKSRHGNVSAGSLSGLKKIIPPTGICLRSSTLHRKDTLERRAGSADGSYKEI